MPLFKPAFDHGGGGIVNSSGNVLTVYDADGKVIFHGNGQHGSEGTKWQLPISQLKAGFTFSIDGGPKFNLKDPTQRQEFKQDNGGDPTSVGGKGSLGAGGGTTGVPPGFAPGSVGPFGATPAFQGNNFPSPTFANFTPAASAPYEFTDPTKFAEAFGNFNTNQVIKNYNLSKNLALDTLDTELAALKGFVPAASALKRSETSIDNTFNQAERTRQVDTALPGARQDLLGQEARANSYANGKVPSAIEDRAFEVSSRSAAADTAAQGGFGASSSAARKASDLLSVNDRINLSKYGDALLGQNVTQRQNLELAPTEYSNAGAQVNVNPSVSPSQLITQGLQTLNQNTLISPSEALNSNVQQHQFQTTTQNQVNQFNSTGAFQASQFNANASNEFALQHFNYNVAYAGAVAGAAQTNINANVALQQQQQALDIFKNYLGQAQNAQQLSAITGLLGALTGSGATSGIINAITNLIKGNTGTTNPTNNGTANLPPGTSQGFPGTVTAPAGSTPPPGFVVVGQNTDGSLVFAPQQQIDNTSNQTPSQTPTEPSNPNGVTSPTEPQPPPQPPETWTSNGENGDNSPPQSTPPPVDNTPINNGERAPAARNPGQAAPDQRIPAPIQAQLGTFTEATGIPTGKSTVQDAQALSQVATGVLQSAGISTHQVPGMKPAGYDTNGNPIFTSAALNAVNNPSVAGDVTASLKKVLAPLPGVLTPQDSKNLDNIGAKAGNPQTINALDAAKKSGNAQAFVNTVLNTFGQGAAQSLVKNPDNKAGVSAAFTAYNLFQNWDSMSTTQKALGLAHLGISTFQFTNGHDLGSNVIFKPTLDASGHVITPGLTVGQALNIVGAGYNVYNLVDNWNKFSTIQKIAGGATTAASVSQVAQQLGLLNSKGAVANALGTAGGVASVALGTKAVIDGWGAGGTKGAVNGLLGGSAIVGGLAVLGYTNPYTAAAIIAVSVLGDTIHTGKSTAQLERDAVRSNLTKNGVISKDFTVNLPDGTVANLGVDGHGGTHTASNPEQLVKNRKLSSFDLDYTNDLDYASGMAGNTLSRIINGGKGTPVDQLGAQLGNAGLGKIGFNKQMTPENFNTVMQNQRAIFAKAGLKSKDDVYALAAKMLKDGRIDAFDAHNMQVTANMMYDKNGFQTAQKLMAGRTRGIEVIGHNPPTTHTNTPPPKVTTTNGAPPPKVPTNTNTSGLQTAAEIKAKNKKKFQSFAGQNAFGEFL